MKAGASSTADPGGERPIPDSGADVRHHPARLEALRATGLLDTPSEPAFDRLTRLAVAVLGVPAAFFSLVDEQRDFYKAATGFAEPLASQRELSGATFCHLAIASPGPLVIPDTAADPRYREIPTVRSLGVAAYVGVPLLVSGQPIGSFCAIDTRPHAWTDAEVQVLTDLADMTLREIALRNANRLLEEQTEQLRNLSDEIARGSAAFEATFDRLTESEARYRALFESLDQGFAVVELIVNDEGRAHDYRFLEANPAFQKQTGLRSPVGRTARELVPTIEEHWFEAYSKVVETGEAIRFVHHSGELGRWYDTYAFLVGQREDRRVAMLFTDITARKLAEVERERLLRQLQVERERLAEVFRQAPAFLAVMRGPDHVFDLVNEAFYQLVGHRDVLGRAVFDALPEISGQGFEELMDEVLTTGEPFVGRELPLRVQRSPGAEVEDHFIDLTYLPLIEEDGTRVGVIAHGTDVTAHVHARREVERLLKQSEQARAEAELARREAEAAGRLKSEFLSTMSHEFRTPLNAILGYAQLLDMGVLGPATPAQHAHLERLQTSARHLLKLVDDVLDVAKVEADRLEVRHDTLVTSAAVSSALALVQPQAVAKGIRLDTREAAGRSVPYIGDEHRVRQILVNLLSNAVKFTPPGGTITVSAGAAMAPDPGVQPGGPGSRAAHALAGHGARDRAWAYLRVKDTGEGITSDLEGRLFEPFTQGDGALTRTQGGTGLGLAISRRLARLMGGDLVVENRLGIRRAGGGGATFTVWLPAPGDAPAAVAEVSTPAAPMRERRSSGPMTSMPERPGSWIALPPSVYPVLHALGVRLSTDAELVAAKYVAAIRADGRFPGATELPDVQLRDHATPMVSLLASQLMTLGETRGRAPELLADGAHVQRVMAELHGAQRHRLGWSEADVAREEPLLAGQVERALRDAARGHGEVDAESVELATRYAVELSRQTLEQETGVALRAYRFARAGATP